MERCASSCARLWGQGLAICVVRQPSVAKKRSLVVYLVVKFHRGSVCHVCAADRLRTHALINTRSATHAPPSLGSVRHCASHAASYTSIRVHTRATRTPLTPNAHTPPPLVARPRSVCLCLSLSVSPLSRDQKVSVMWPTHMRPRRPPRTPSPPTYPSLAAHPLTAW